MANFIDGVKGLEHGVLSLSDKVAKDTSGEYSIFPHMPSGTLLGGLGVCKIAVEGQVGADASGLAIGENCPKPEALSKPATLIEAFNPGITGGQGE